MARHLHNRLINGVVDREIERTARLYVRGRLVDVGAGTKPYADVLAPYVTEHVGVDHDATEHGLGAIDIVATAYDIPVPDGSFDSAIATSVLEHLEEPELALREIHRILAPGGYVVITVPHMWHLHEEPRDFYRFTRHGLRYLLEKVGFEVVEIKPLTGFWGTTGQFFAYYVNRANRGILRRLRVVDAAVIVIQWIAGGLDRIDRAERWTAVYLAVGRKREGNQ